MADYNPTHIVVRPFGDVGANQVGKTVEIPDPARAELLIESGHVRPYGTDFNYNPMHMVVRPFGNVDQVGERIDIPDPTRAELLIEDGLIRPLSPDESDAPLKDDLSAIGVINSTSVRELPKLLRSIDNLGVLKSASGLENRESARKLISRRIRKLKESSG